MWARCVIACAFAMSDKVLLLASGSFVLVAAVIGVVLALVARSSRRAAPVFLHAQPANDGAYWGPMPAPAPLPADLVAPAPLPPLPTPAPRVAPVLSVVAGGGGRQGAPVIEGARPRFDSKSTLVGLAPEDEDSKVTVRRGAPAEVVEDSAVSRLAVAALARPTGAALKLTHVGEQFTLGYGADFYGIWYRRLAGAATQRFPRTADGWIDAWAAFSELEPEAVSAPESTRAAS